MRVGLITVFETHETNLSSLIAGRNVATEIDERQSRELQEKDQELAERVWNATLEQIRLKFDADLKVLSGHVPSVEKEQLEANMDLKYLSQRQQ